MFWNSLRMSRHPRFSSLPNLCSNCRTCIQQSSSNRFANLQSDYDQSNQLFNFAEEEAVVMAHELEHLNLDPYVSNNVLATLKKHLVQGMQNYQSRLRSSCPESTVFNQSRPVSCRARSSSSSSFPPLNPCPSPSPSNNFHHSKTPFQSGMSSQPCSPDSCLPFPIIPPVCSPSPNPSHTPSPNINSKRPNEPSPDCLSRSHTPECRLNPNRYDLAPQVPLGHPSIKCQMDQSQSPQLNNRHDNEVHPLCQESGVCRAALSPNLPQSQDPESMNLDCSQITKVYLLKECSPVEESPCCQLILQSSPQQQLDDQGYPPCSRTRQSELSRVNRRFCGENHGHSSPRRQMEPQVPDHESQPQQQVSVACSPHPCLSAVLVCSPRKNNSCPCKKQNCPLSKEKQDLLASNPIVRCGFLRLVATFHGKLTRDLFITEKVIDMIRMIKDTAEVLLSFCSDKKSTLEKEEEQFACRLQSQLQSSLSRLHHLFIETTPEERLAALRGSHNWRVANNFGQPRQRSPPVPALACGTSLPTPRTPLYNPSPQGSPSPAPQQRQRRQEHEKPPSDASSDVLRFCDDWYQCNRLCALANLRLNLRAVPATTCPPNSPRTACSTCQRRTQPPPSSLLERKQAPSSRNQRQGERRSSLERNQHPMTEKGQWQSERSRCLAERLKPLSKENPCPSDRGQLPQRPLKRKQCQMNRTRPLGRSKSSGEKKQRHLDQCQRSPLSPLMLASEEVPRCLDSWEEEGEKLPHREEMVDSPRPLVRLWREGSEKSLDSSDLSNAAIAPCSGSRDESLTHSQDLVPGSPVSAVVTIPGFLSVNLHRWPSRHSLHIYMPDCGPNQGKQNDAPQEPDECQAITLKSNPSVEEAPNGPEMLTMMSTSDTVEKKKTHLSCCGKPRNNSSNTNNTTCPSVPHPNEEDVEVGVEVGVNLRLQMYRMANQLRQEKRLLRGRVMPFRHTKFRRYIHRSHRRCLVERLNSPIASPTSTSTESVEDWIEEEEVEETSNWALPTRQHCDEPGAWNAIPISQPRCVTKSNCCQRLPRRGRRTSGALVAFRWNA